MMKMNGVIFTISCELLLNWMDLKYGSTALMYAVTQQHLEIIKCIVEQGQANVDLADDVILVLNC